MLSKSNSSDPSQDSDFSDVEIVDVPDFKSYLVREDDVITSSHFGYVYSLLLADLPFLGGQVLLSGAGDGTVKIWSAQEGPLKEIRTLVCDSGNVVALAISDDLLFCGCQGGEIKIWDLETFQVVRTLLSHDDDVMALITWNGHFDCVQTALGHQGIVLSLAIAGPYLVSGAGDHTVKFWDVGHPATSSFALQQRIEVVPSDKMLYALERMVAIPSISGKFHHHEDCRHAANLLKSVMRQMGADARLVYSKDEKRNPLVIGKFFRTADDASRSRVSPRNKLNVLFYGHYDVVPADERHWRFPPFQVTGMYKTDTDIQCVFAKYDLGENGYLYGRGVTDDKGPIMAAVFAASELQDEKSLDVDVSFVIEGEEENGSVGFPEMVEACKDYFGKPDVILLSNSYWLGEERPCLTYGLRGLVHATIQVSDWIILTDKYVILIGTFHTLDL
jgi:di- and tripeptidase